MSYYLFPGRYTKPTELLKGRIMARAINRRITSALNEPSKADLKKMLAEAARNTAAIVIEEVES